MDFHPATDKALADGAQALHLSELALFLQDITISRSAYEQRQALSLQATRNSYTHRLDLAD